MLVTLFSCGVMMRSKLAIVCAATLVVVAPRAQDSNDLYDKLVRDFRAAKKRAGKLPTETFATRFLKAAKAFEDSDAALPFLGWLVRNARDERVQKRVEASLSRRTDALLAKVEADGQDLATWAKNGLRKLYRSGRGKPTDRQLASRLIQCRALEKAADDDRTKRMARGTAFEMTRLQVGMQAPDIAGEDLDGVAFKLSDYRGKVIVLDFWGDW